MRKNHGLNKYPRLIEFQNSRFVVEDFFPLPFKYLNVRDMMGNILEEFAHQKEHDWYLKDNTRITAGELIKRIYSHCNPEVYLDIYMIDCNPSNYRDMRINKVLTYHLSLGNKYADCRNRVKQGYNLECEDDVKVFNNLGQVMELSFS